jgi:pimeloyl-ACP methyl ester carboxylesterase
MTNPARFIRRLGAGSAFGATLGDQMVGHRAAEWHASGEYFEWTSPLAENKGRKVKIFYVCAGETNKPTILMLHGFPTSSFDVRPVFELLKADYRVCTLDFPGFGVSDKPLDGFAYSLAQDAQLVWDFATEFLEVNEFILFSHDRGDSVALRFLQLYQAADLRPFRITHQFLTNANLYLPLANLTRFQDEMLNPTTSAIAVRAVTPERLATGLGKTQYWPPLAPDDPEIQALIYNFAYQDGVRVIPKTIQYLNERKQFELDYLASLAKSDVPATLIWGIHDTVSPVRVANHVWGRALKARQAPASYWLVPCASHYLMHDQPLGVVAVMRAELDQKGPAAPSNLTTDACSPVLLDRH